MRDNIFPSARKKDVVVQQLADEVLIYDLKSNKALCLNEVSAFVWQNCDGKKTISEINQLAIAQLNPDSSKELIWLALDQLKKENLLEDGEAVESTFANFSRREIIKKIGLTSMAVLPLVTSIAAPTAVLAQSNCMATETITQTNRTCDNPTQSCLQICQAVYGPTTTLISCTDDSPVAGSRTCLCCIP